MGRRSNRQVNVFPMLKAGGDWPRHWGAGESRPPAPLSESRSEQAQSFPPPTLRQPPPLSPFFVPPHPPLSCPWLSANFRLYLDILSATTPPHHLPSPPHASPPPPRHLYILRKKKKCFCWLPISMNSLSTSICYIANRIRWHKSIWFQKILVLITSVQYVFISRQKNFFAEANFYELFSYNYILKNSCFFRL